MPVLRHPAEGAEEAADPWKTGIDPQMKVFMVVFACTNVMVVLSDIVQLPRLLVTSSPWRARLAVSGTPADSSGKSVCEAFLQAAKTRALAFWGSQ